MREISLLMTALSCFINADLKEITPKETDELFANPGMGWQTFHRFADEDKALQGLPSTSAYFRFYWSEIEPIEGQIDFVKFDQLLEKARKAGQKLAFRIMCAGTDNKYMSVPQWLKDKGCPGFEYKYQDSGQIHWVPDMNNPIFQKAHFRMIQELGKRYDGHPDIDLLDIGSVGLWGEWHMSGTGVEVPSLETRLAIIDEWRKAFPITPKVMLIGDENGMIHATKNGCGWRADCLGDMGGFSKTWNHMDCSYPQQIVKTNSQDVWKSAPVAFESCWDMRKWKQEGWDIRYIYDYGLGYHVSYMNNKSAPIPEGTIQEVERFLRKIGYRIVLRQLKHSKEVKEGSPLSISMIWENVGVAPPYRDYMLAFRFTNKGISHVIVDNTSIKGWLPGKIEINKSINLPDNIKSGNYDLAIGIVDKTTNKPAIRLAIEGRAEDGWYPISSFEAIK
jgi:hypothetical protein